MAQNTRLAPRREQTARAFDDDANGAEEFITYGADPASEREAESAQDETVPLFLSKKGAHGRGPLGFALVNPWDWSSLFAAPWLIKAAVVAGTAAIMALGVVYLEDSFSLFSNAKASLFGTSDDQYADSQTAQPADTAGPFGNAFNNAYTGGQSGASTVGVRMGAPGNRTAPTRDDLSYAFRAARQNPTDAATSQGAAPTARSLDPDEVVAMLKRAKVMIATGDIVAARLLLERAAGAQDATAALLLAQTYDPAVLGNQDARTIMPDRAAARVWYQRAAGLGSLNAQQRLAQMQN